MPINIILTGATGMVGEGVLLECLQHPDVAAVLVIGRRPCGIQHPKVRELITPDLSDIAAYREQLAGYDACLFCLGVSSVGMKEADYYRNTYTLTLGFARTLSAANPQMTFCYVSGAGTDSTEQGRQMWARVKGKTENALRRLPFKAVYLFRPAYLHATPGQQRTWKAYKYMSWLYPVLRRLVPQYASTMQQLARAMIRAAVAGYSRPVLEVTDINTLSGIKG